MKLDVKAAAIAGGIVCGVYFFLLTWWVMIFDGISNEPMFVAQVYRGFTVSPIGSLLGLLYGTVDGAIGAAMFAWIYNFIGKPKAKEL